MLCIFLYPIFCVLHHPILPTPLLPSVGSEFSEAPLSFLLFGIILQHPSISGGKIWWFFVRLLQPYCEVIQPYSYFGIFLEHIPDWNIFKEAAAFRGFERNIIKARYL